MRISRSSFYYEGKGEIDFNLALMRLIDEQFLETPYRGFRQIARHIRRQGHNLSRKRIRLLMLKMGRQAAFQRPRTSQPHPEHRVNPYLLRGLTIDIPNMVWCSDTIYIPLQQGFHYLVAIMGWYSRRIMSWWLSNTLDSAFRVEALDEALGLYGPSTIIRTDQGCQFTSLEFIATLKDAGVRISMDGRGRWMDNIFIERLRRSLKYESVYLHKLTTGSQAREAIGRWISRKNDERPHSALEDRAPTEAYLDLELGSSPGSCREMTRWSRAA